MSRTRVCKICRELQPKLAKELDQAQSTKDEKCYPYKENYTSLPLTIFECVRLTK